VVRRLIEEAFPLKKVSEDSKHEKSVRHGHISTLHIWPARRPLAASRAAIAAALLSAGETEADRDELLDLLRSVTRWGSENGPNIEKLRRLIREAYGGRAPRLLDMFAGGGAIPFEGLRLGCEVTAVDYNPVAWFILKCALDYPSRLAGQDWPLPIEDGTLVQTKRGDLEAHVRYWGGIVLAKAREALRQYYPAVKGLTPVAYLWARTIPCQDPHCGIPVPLLRTFWLCRKGEKRRALKVTPSEAGVTFRVFSPATDDEVAARGIVFGTGVTCPKCGSFMRWDYVEAIGKASQMGAVPTAVVLDGPNGKEYETLAEPGADAAADALRMLESGSLPDEPLPPEGTLGFRVQRYGFKQWQQLFTPRQLLAQATFVRLVREAHQTMLRSGYPDVWAEAVTAYLAAAVDRIADHNSSICTWTIARETSGHTFARYALPMTWDFMEINPVGDSTGCFDGAVDWVGKFAAHATSAADPLCSHASVFLDSAESLSSVEDASADLVVTDPPYYDAIPYADISDFFYVWLRRSVGWLFPDQFSAPTTPKAGELVQKQTDGVSKQKARQLYESGMTRAFQAAHRALRPAGIMVMVFAHKDPLAWETLVAATMDAGFTVSASWPINTEWDARTRAHGSAALASSVWLVCRKRPADAGVGRYAAVRDAMRARITERLNYFWDQGISGPDFVWAAIGPALESYSSYAQVKRLDGTRYTVSEFLREVRRMVTDFALGRILHGTHTEALDEWTAYYLMHRYNFGTVPAPVGECILLSGGYGLDLNDLKGPRGFLAKGNAPKAHSDEDGEAEPATSGGSGSELRLLAPDERRHPDLGQPHPKGGLPYIDMLHRLLRHWAANDVPGLREYVAGQGLGDNALFWAVAQAVLEMAEPKSRERSQLEGVVAAGRGHGEVAAAADRPRVQQVPGT